MCITNQAGKMYGSLSLQCEDAMPIWGEALRCAILGKHCSNQVDSFQSMDSDDTCFW